MSDRKQGLNKINLHRDEQFQIINLAQDSSQDSSKKEDLYQRRYLDVSDAEDKEQDRKSIRSMEDIQAHDQVSQTTASPNSTKNQENKLMPSIAYNNNSSQGNFQVETPKSSESPQKEPRKRRQKIYRSPQKSEEKAEDESKGKKVLNRVAFEKKRENHTMLKHWNYCRINQLEFHRSIAQEILKSIDKNVKLGLENLQTYRTFFTQRMRQQQNYANSIFTDSDRLHANEQTLGLNIHSSNIYMSCSSMLQSLARKNKKQKELAQNLASLIQIKILKETFSQYFDNVHKQSLSLRSKIAQTKAVLAKLDGTVCEKLIQLETQFSECCQDVNKEASRDFYRLEVSFLRKCQTEMIFQAKYGALILDYLNYVRSEEEIRHELIQKSLRIYEEGLNKYNSDLICQTNPKSSSPKKQSTPTKTTNTPSPSPSSSSCTKSSTIKQMYTLQNLIPTFLLQSLLQRLRQQHQNTLSSSLSQSLAQFLSKCSVDKFDLHHLILKQFDVCLYQSEEWVQGWLILSVDSFLHFGIHDKQVEKIVAKPYATVKVNLVQLVFDDDIKDSEHIQVILQTKVIQSRLDKLKQFIKGGDRILEKIRFPSEAAFLQFQDFLIDLS